jgi:2-keto-4-pentenoate hydratase/2-oxohepta-3-ene-1,7-dioic acid hydratase in catechol pathway
VQLNRPGKIVCVGRNYREHAKELGNDVPVEPLLFLKPSTSIIGTGEKIVLPPFSQQVEYEGEIGVVVGRRLVRAPESETRGSISAIVALNDVTARDLQRRDSQWTRAKGFDTFCPIGNPIAPLDDLATLTVTTRVNGAIRQQGSAAEMVFPITMLLSYVSYIMTLEPGDILATGTPSGVGKIVEGDEVEVQVGESTVRNAVTAR